MARRQVVEIVCDRCGKLENQIPEGSAPAAPELDLVFRGGKLTYQDLCQNCRKAVANYIQKISKEGEARPPAEKAPEQPAKKGLLSRLT